MTDIFAVVVVAVGGFADSPQAGPAPLMVIVKTKGIKAHGEDNKNNECKKLLCKIQW